MLIKELVRGKGVAGEVKRRSMGRKGDTAMDDTYDCFLEHACEFSLCTCCIFLSRLMHSQPSPNVHT